MGIHAVFRTALAGALGRHARLHAGCDGRAAVRLRDPDAARRVSLVGCDRGPGQLRDADRLIGRRSCRGHARRPHRALPHAGLHDPGVFHRSGLSATSTGIVSLLVWRTLVGLGLGGEWSAGAVLVSESWPPQHRAKAIGLMQSGWAIGYMLAAAMTALILPRFGWRVLFLVGVLPALLTDLDPAAK